MAYTLYPSDYTANRILNKELGAANYTVADPLYMRLFTTVLTAAGAGTELTAAGYAATAFDNDTTMFPTTTTRSKTNTAAIETAEIEEDCLVKGIGFFDAGTGGNMLYYANNPSGWNITEGQTFKIKAGELTLELN